MEGTNAVRDYRCTSRQMCVFDYRSSFLNLFSDLLSKYTFHELEISPTIVSRGQVEFLSRGRFFSGRSKLYRMLEWMNGILSPYPRCLSLDVQGVVRGGHECGVASLQEAHPIPHQQALCLPVHVFGTGVLHHPYALEAPSITVILKPSDSLRPAYSFDILLRYKQSRGGSLAISASPELKPGLEMEHGLLLSLENQLRRIHFEYGVPLTKYTLNVAEQTIDGRTAPLPQKTYEMRKKLDDLLNFDEMPV